jgi:carboxypeptidase Q
MSRLLKTSILLLVACLLPSLALLAQQPAPPAAPDQATAKDVVKAVEKPEPPKPPTDPIERIKEEGLKRSQVMETLSYLTDVIGPRLTGSPQMKRANEWTRDKLAGWGLEDAHLEPWGPFGRGWSLVRFSAQVVEPQCIPLIACPRAWSPGVEGTLVAEVVHFDAKTEEEFARFKGKLKGAIVLSGEPRALSAAFEPMATRLSDKELLTLADAAEPSPRGPGRRSPSDGPRDATAGAGSSNPVAGTGDGSGAAPAPQQPAGPRFQGSPEMRARLELERKKLRFFIDEGVALLVEPSRRGDGGTLFVGSAAIPVASPPPAPSPGGRRVGPWDKDAPATVPQLVLADEHYNRLVRMIRQGETPKMAVELAVRFHDDDPMGYNTIAEIPGTDLRNELVMLGGHMDSWHGGTGATDNAAGVSVAMEAVRILKALDLKPRRTVRIALWSGEEQGLFGSRAYVEKHFGKRRGPGSPGSPSPGDGAAPGGASVDSIKPEYEAFSAYFNLDNGTGKVRGVYLQGNEAVRPIFRKWLQPFRDLGASTLSIANTGGTDHQSFDGINLPGFQFIQDGIEYRARTHHSNQDVYDRIQADDMKQAAVIMAAFVYNTAMRDEKLPRKPSPR